MTTNLIKLISNNYNKISEQLIKELNDIRIYNKIELL